MDTQEYLYNLITKSYERLYGKKNFPDYLPLEVKISYMSCISTMGENKTQVRKTLEKLINTKSMNYVWKKFLDCYEGLELEVITSFFALINDSLYSIPYWEKLTIKEREESFDETINLMCALSQKLKKFNLANNIYKGFSSSELLILNIMHDTARDDGNIGKHGTKVRTNKIPEAPDLVYSTFTYSNPSLAILLDRHVKILQEEQPHKKSFISKPNAKNANRTYFIRKLAEFNYKNFKTPLHKVIATTASVFFDDVSEEEVRNVLRKK